MALNLASGTNPLCLEVDHVTKVFHLAAHGSRWLGRPSSAPAVHKAIDDVAFNVAVGETVGLLGVNGAGKSTLLQLIAGTLSPTEGQVRVHGRVSALLELGAGFNPEWSGRQNAEFHTLIHGARKSELPAILKRIEEFADVGHFFEQPMKTYSSGMFARVAFAAAVAVDPEILIVDEALAVGDAKFQHKCLAYFRKLREMGKTILFVSHSTDTVSQFCTRGIVMDHGHIHFDGPAEGAVAAYMKLLYGSGAPSARMSPRQVRAADDASLKQDMKAIADLFAWPPDRERLPQRGYYNPHAASAGRVIGHVIDVLILDEDDQPILGPIPAGKRFRIAVQIMSGQEIRRPHIGVSLKTKDNTLVYGVTNIMLGKELSPLSADEALVAIFEIDNPLAHGDYFVDIGLADFDRDELVVIEWRMSLLHISVSSPSQHYGFVDLLAGFVATRPRRTPT